MRCSATTAVILCFVTAAAGQTLPAGFAHTNLVSGGMINPTCFVIAPDGRIFIGQQGGAIRVWKSGSGLLATPFHQFTVNSGSERGLIGLALDPDFATNRQVYAHISRTTPSSGGSIVRIVASVASPDVSDGSVTPLLFLGDSDSQVHVGGALRFGPDGKLYVGVGDNADPSNAQSLNNLFGKVLRLNRDGTIPSDNPLSFSGVAGSPTGANRAIWALGLRNPFTFAIHPLTGRVLVNDVGNSSFEEVNDAVAGANFGWPATEGEFDPATYPQFTRPAHAYGRSIGTAIVGGVIYAPPVSPYPPAYYGTYFFADYSVAWIKRMNPVTRQVSDWASNAGNPVDLQVDSSGRLYCLGRGSNRIWRVDYTMPLLPTVVAEPQPRTVAAGATVAFEVVVCGSPALAYRWRRNTVELSDGGNVSGAQTRMLRFTGVGSADAGDYDCIVSNSHGGTTSAVAALTVVPIGPGDVNCDQAVNFLDIDPFVLAIFDPAGYAAAFPACSLSSADVNEDGRVDFLDIDPFVACILDGCP